MRELTREDSKRTVGGGLNWQCKKCKKKGWGIISSFIHNMIPGHNSFKTW